MNRDGDASDCIREHRERKETLELLITVRGTQTLLNGFGGLLDCARNSSDEEDWGRMAIVDTKPFKLRVILHRIFVERPQVTGIPAWPGGAACYRRSRYIL